MSGHTCEGSWVPVAGTNIEECLVCGRVRPAGGEDR